MMLTKGTTRMLRNPGWKAHFARTLCAKIGPDPHGGQNLTWSKVCTLKQRAACQKVSRFMYREYGTDQWKTPFTLKEPEFDLPYILDPGNYDTIKANIVNRKGVGDLDLVLELWKKLNTETDAAIKEGYRKEFLAAVSCLPNQSHPQSPVGEESEAKQVDLVGKRRDFKFIPKTMVELGDTLGMLRTNNVNITTGGGTYYFTDQLAQLEHALVQYTVDHLLNKGFELMTVPDLLHPDVIESCGFKTTGDVTQVYRMDPGRHGDLCLAGTSEMSLAGYFIDEVMKQEDLPLRLAAVSRCYRAETSHLDTEAGIYRVHQFTKVEMFGVAGSEQQAEELLHEFIDTEKSLFSQLGLHYRVLDMPTAELGAPAHRKFDIETWMPAKQFWGEISSASNCTDYQSRRLNIKCRTASGEVQHCYTVNGTACAVPRTIMAICESFQQENGSVQLPGVLWDYMGGARSVSRQNNIPGLKWIKYARTKK